jgi:hypothetical protein
MFTAGLDDGTRCVVFPGQPTSSPASGRVNECNRDFSPTDDHLLVLVFRVSASAVSVASTGAWQYIDLSFEVVEESFVDGGFASAKGV